jgi:hypothetical protein
MVGDRGVDDGLDTRVEIGQPDAVGAGLALGFAAHAHVPYLHVARSSATR